MEPKRTPVSAEDFMNQLSANQDFLALKAAQERENAAVEQRLKQIEAPLLADLRASGIRVNSVWELVNSSSDYGRALPVLVEHLGRPYPGVIAEGIGRALAVPLARPYWRQLLELYRSTPDSIGSESEPSLPKGSRRLGIAIALSAIAGPDEFDDLVTTLEDHSLGPTRSALVLGLYRSKSPHRLEVLRRLSADEDLRAEVDLHLAKLGSTSL